MPKALKVTRAPSGEPSTLVVRRDGKPDLQFEGVLLLTVETEPIPLMPPSRSWGRNRWKKFFLYKANLSTVPLRAGLIVVEEGHSSVSTEVTRYSATVCKGGAEAWVALDAMEELKEVFADIGFPAVERLEGGS
jgi:hypothetical protein